MFARLFPIFKRSLGFLKRLSLPIIPVLLIASPTKSHSLDDVTFKYTFQKLQNNTKVELTTEDVISCFNLDNNQRKISVNFLDFLKKYNIIDISKYNGLSPEDIKKALVADLAIYFDRGNSELFHDNTQKLAWIQNNTQALDEFYDELVPVCYGGDDTKITSSFNKNDKVIVVIPAGHIGRYQTRLSIAKDAVKNYSNSGYDVEVVVISGARMMEQAEFEKSGLTEVNVSNENEWWGGHVAEIASATNLPIHKVHHLGSLDCELGGARASTEDNANLLVNYLKSSRQYNANLIYAIEHPFAERMVWTNQFYIKKSGLSASIEQYKGAIVADEFKKQIASRSHTFTILNSMYRILQNQVVTENRLASSLKKNI